MPMQCSPDPLFFIGAGLVSASRTVDVSIEGRMPSWLVIHIEVLKGDFSSLQASFPKNLESDIFTLIVFIRNSIGEQIKYLA